MSAANEKAAWVFVPPQAAQEIAHDEFTATDKRLTTVSAQMALAGHAVHKPEDGFPITRWGMSCFCPDLGSLVAFGRILGVSK